jgi:hypothetical protein
MDLSSWLHPDDSYLKHRTEAEFDNSPTGREIRLIPKGDTGKGEKSTVQEGVEYDMHSGKPVGEQPTLTPQIIEQHKAEGEANRQAKLQKNLAKPTPAQPPVLDLGAFEYPAEVVREAIAKKINEARGTNLTGENVAAYIAGGVTEGDPVSHAVTELAVNLATDPLTYLPGIGLAPKGTYTKVGEGVTNVAAKVGEASKAAGVDLASEAGMINNRLLTPDVFYSPTQRVIEAKVPTVATPQQVQATLANSGVSPEEAKWMDLDGFLAGKEVVKKDELLQFVKENQVEIKEVERTPAGERSKPEDTQRLRLLTQLNDMGRLETAEQQAEFLALSEKGAQDDTKFSQYTLPGGTNYREVLLTLPEQTKELPVKESYSDRTSVTVPDTAANFKSPHFDEPNILVHMRLNDRLDAEGKRTLFIEEIQSDWHQKGRQQGYAGEAKTPEEAKQFFGINDETWAGLDDAQRQSYLDEMNSGEPHVKSGRVPDAPFKKTWHELALKRVLRMAAEEGYERIAWTTGAQQAERYDLAKQIDAIDYNKNADGTFDLFIVKDGKVLTEQFNMVDTKLEDFVGKDVAKKIVAGEGHANEDGRLTLEGLDLKVGGEGMKGFYDEIVPRFLNKYGKKWGSKVEETTLPAPSKLSGKEIDALSDAELTQHLHSTATPEGFKVHSLPVTPAMSEAVVRNPQSLMGSTFQAVDEYLQSLPKIIRNNIGNEKGSVNVQPAMFLTRAILGAVAGSMAGDEENAVRNAVIGALGGGLASPALIKRIAGLVKGGATKAPKTAGQATEAGAEAAPVASLDIGHFQNQYRNLVEFQKRGVVSDPEAMAGGEKLIDYAAITPETIQRLMPGTALNVEEMYALHKVLTESGRQVLDLAGSVTDDASFQEFLKAFWTHGMVLDPKRFGAAAESARSERILGVNKPVEMEAMRLFLDQFSGLMKEAKTGVSAQRLLEMVKELETPEQLASFAKNAVKPEFKDAFVPLFINSLLSAPTTHVFNGLGNTAMSTMSIFERQIAGLAGGEVRPGEALAMVQGMFAGFGDALTLAAKVAREGEDAAKFGASKGERPPKALFADVEKLGPFGPPLDYLSAFMEGAGGRLLLTADEFFKSINFQMEIHALSLREAYNVANAEGLTGKKLAAKVKELTEQYRADVPVDIQQKAEKFAAYNTMTTGLGEFGQWLTEGSNKFLAVKLVVPFIKAPLNIFKIVGERSPLALLAKSTYHELNQGGARAELTLAKLQTGALLTGLGVLWASDGLITGAGPDSKKFPDQAKVWREAGYMPYSLNVSAIKRKAMGEDPTWRKGDVLKPINRIEPLGSMLGMAANYYELVANGYEKTEDLAASLALATFKAMSSKTWIQGLSRTMLAFAMPDEFLTSTIEKEVISLTPVLGAGMTNFATKQLDPVVREADGIIEEARKRTPGLSKDLLPRLHPITGEPIVFSPLKGEFKDDKVLNEIVKHGTQVSTADDEIHGVKLTPEAAHELQKIITHEVKKGGRNLHESLAHMMETGTYKRGSDGPDGRKSLMIRHLVHAFVEMGELKMLKKHPEIKQAMKDAAKEKARKMKSVPVVPSDDAIENSTVDLDALTIAGN